MKRLLSITLALLMLLTLAACGERTRNGTEQEYPGTWELDHVAFGGSTFTLDELEALGEGGIQARMVLKEGGKGYTSEGNEGAIIDWEKTETGIRIGEQEMVFEDGFLHGEIYDDTIWYFKKVSDSQVIEVPGPQETQQPQTEAAETTETEQTQNETEEHVSAGFSPDAKPIDKTVYCAEGFDFICYDDGSIELTKYVGGGKTVDISTEIGGYPVSRIGESAFEGASVEKIYMWAEPIQIGKGAFRNCKQLETIDVPSSVTVIEADTFRGCTALKRAYIWGDITSIGESAFQGCTALESIDISSACEKIGKSAFEDCKKMEHAYFWGDPEIGERAFKNCSSLKQVDIPSDTHVVGASAFEGCTSLEKVYAWGDDVAYGENAFANCPNLRELPKGVVFVKTAQASAQEDSGTLRPEFKAAMDAYEEFYGEYCEFLEKYSENPSDATLIGQYGKMMAKMTEVNAAFEKWDDADMTTAEAAYYLEVNGRVLQKLAKVMG